MDLRTKLVFAFVAATLASMFVLGAAFYNASAEILESISARQLESLAAARQQDFQVIGDSWFDQVRLISSRTKLRDSLKQYADSPSPGLREDMQRILQDAQDAVSIVTRIALYDANNSLITFSGNSEAPLQQSIEAPIEEIQFSNFHVRESNGVDAIVLATLSLDTEVVGVLETVVNTDSLTALANDYTGLGPSGEFYVVAEVEPGEVTTLNTLRHRESNELLRYPISEAPEHVLAGLNQIDNVFRDTHDYRGVRVWAATRHLDRVSGGLIVKIDEDVELARVYELRDELTDLALALAAFAVLAGTLMGIHLSGPLRDLATVVDRIKHGERNVRAEIAGEDEVSFLAESFNELMDDMQPKPDDDTDD